MGKKGIIMDVIEVKGLKVRAFHGVMKEEQIDGQDFYLDIKLYYDITNASHMDDLDEAVDYAACSHLAAEAFAEETFHLIEAAAEHVARRLLYHFARIRRLELTVHKPQAPIGRAFSDVCIRVTREWHTVYLSVGSNMGDKEAYIRDAFASLAKHPDIRNAVLSRLIETEPYGPVVQDDFLNGAICLETLLGPESLLELLHELEAQAGRERKEHWGPRTLDLDILFYDKLVYESGDLIIPHVDLENRMFVLVPLAQMCPNLRHPILQKTVVQMLDELAKKHGKRKGTAS